MRLLVRLGSRSRIAAMIVATLMIGVLTTGCGMKPHSMKRASIIDVNWSEEQNRDGAKPELAATADMNTKQDDGITLASAAPPKPKPSATAEADTAEHAGKTAMNPVKPMPILLQKPTEPAVSYVPKKGAKLVALTFDDGPDGHFTPAILAILKASKIHATFFTVGIQVKHYGSMMKRIKAEGNEIGNHSYSHKDLSKLDRNQILSQIKQADVLINKQSGYVPRIVRAPYGAVSPLLRTIMKENHRDLIGWSVDTRDWAGSSVATMRANVNKNTHPGGIILMHSFGSKLDNTVQLLPLIIKDLKSKGYTFVTVSELLAAKADAKAKAKAKAKATSKSSQSSQTSQSKK